MINVDQLKQHMAHIILSPQSTLNLIDKTITSPPNIEEYNSVTCSLQEQDRIIDHIVADGNCMFWSLSKELFGTQCHHLQLRKLISDFEEHNPNIINSLSNDSPQLQDEKRSCVGISNRARNCSLNAPSTSVYIYKIFIPDLHLAKIWPFTTGKSMFS